MILTCATVGQRDRRDGAIEGGCQLAILLISWHLTSLSLLSPSGCHYESGSGGQGPRGSREGGPVDGPHIALLLPPCVVLAASSIVSHQMLIVVWQTPFISLCTIPAPGVECRRTRGSGIIAVVVASCTCYNVRNCAISQCTTLGLIRSLPLGRWGCLRGVRWAQQGIEDASVGMVGGAGEPEEAFFELKQNIPHNTWDACGLKMRPEFDETKITINSFNYL